MDCGYGFGRYQGRNKKDESFLIEIIELFVGKTNQMMLLEIYIYYSKNGKKSDGDTSYHRSLILIVPNNIKSKTRKVF